MTVQDNKATVQAFYQTALNDRDADAALPYVGTSYRQHNPLVEEGYEGLRKYLDWNPRELPEIAERDPARLRRWPSARRRARGDAIVDIFQLENRKIVEHWDLIQPVPETAANPNTMF
jgi:predicted SnoaL-like aldol condensation-catalyzing enzyme